MLSKYITDESEPLCAGVPAGAFNCAAGNNDVDRVGAIRK
jgi:hypothetical protein